MRKYESTSQEFESLPLHVTFLYRKLVEIANSKFRLFAMEKKVKEKCYDLLVYIYIAYECMRELRLV